MCSYSKKRKFLYDMHYFRAFAIVNILFAHTWKIPPSISNEYKTLNVLSEVLFHDSTIYFIFISGFLFHYLSFNFSIAKYYKSKIFNVITPYIVVSTFVFILKAVLASDMFHLNLSVDLSFSGYLTTIIYGRAQIPFWYIPFISGVFLVSPILLKIKKAHFICFVSVLMLLPLAGTRTGIEISIGQYIYFFPMYCFGMLCSNHYEYFLHISDKFKTFFVSIALLTSIMIFIYLYYGGEVRAIEGVFYEQKWQF